MWQRVTFTATKVFEQKDKPARREVAATHVFDVPDSNRDSLRDIQQDVTEFDGRKVPNQMLEVRGLLKRLRGISFDPATLPMGTGRLTANTVEHIVVTDYSRRMYLNSGKSWPGSSKLAAEFSPDGTLSKADASVESKPTEVATAISSLFPATSVFSALLKVDKADAMLEEEPSYTIELKLEVSPTGFQDDYSLVVRDTSVKEFRPLDDTQLGVSKVRRSLPDGPKESKKDDAPRIGFEGSVVLPQSKKEEKP
jgi:hypothetical protein